MAIPLSAIGILGLGTRTDRLLRLGTTTLTLGHTVLRGVDMSQAHHRVPA
jgi:hypothetical protein